MAKDKKEESVETEDTPLRFRQKYRLVKREGEAKGRTGYRYMGVVVSRDVELVIHALGESMTAARIGRILKLDPKTVRRVLYKSISETAEVKKIRSSLSGKWYRLADQAVETAMEEDDTNKLYRLALTGGIATDKARLAEGLSTENISIKSVAAQIHEELEERKKKLEDFMKVEEIDSREGLK